MQSSPMKDTREVGYRIFQKIGKGPSRLYGLCELEEN